MVTEAVICIKFQAYTHTCLSIYHHDTLYFLSIKWVYISIQSLEDCHEQMS